MAFFRPKNPAPSDVIGDPPPLARIPQGRGVSPAAWRQAKPPDKPLVQPYPIGTPGGAGPIHHKPSPNRHHPYSAPNPHHPPSHVQHGNGQHHLPTFRTLSVTVAGASTSGYVSSTAFGPALSVFRLPSSTPSSNAQNPRSSVLTSASYGPSVQTAVPHTHASSGTVHNHTSARSVSASSSTTGFPSARPQQSLPLPDSGHGVTGSRQPVHRNSQWPSGRHSDSVSHSNLPVKPKEERTTRNSAIAIQMPHVDSIPMQLIASQSHQAQSTQARHVLYPAPVEPITHAQQRVGGGVLVSSGTPRNWQWHHQTLENSKRVEGGKLLQPASEVQAVSTRRSPLPVPPANHTAAPAPVPSRAPVIKSEAGQSDVASIMGQLSSVLLQRCPCPEKLYALTAILLEAMDNGLTCTHPQSTTAVPTSSSQHTATSAPSNDVAQQMCDIPDEVELKFKAIVRKIMPEQARLWQSQVTNDPAENSGNGQFWCRVCRLHFPWRCNLEFHYLSHRSEDKPSVCHICGKCFTRGEHTNRHAYMHNMKEYVCQLCGALFSRASHLEDHWMTDHLNMDHRNDQGADLPHESPEGNNKDTNENLPEPPSPPSNLLSRYTDLVSQINPNKAGKWQSRIKKDPATHSATGDYWCSQCQKTFTWRHQLEFHFLSHRTDERPSVCHVCGKCFTRGDHTNRHAYMHNMKDFVCQLCGEVFCRVSYLGEHWLKEHFAGIDDEPFPPNGSELGSDDNQSVDLNNSMAEAEANGRRANGLMSQSLSSVVNVNPDSFLGRLLDSAQAPEPATMDYAPSPILRTRRRRDRRRSLLSNSPPTRDTSDDDPLFEPMSLSGANSRRPYRCEVCARAFSRLAHLQRHQRTHMGSKPFRCSLCGRSFTRGDYLRAHVVVHHDRNVILCKTCGREFSTMGALTNHQKTHAREKNRKAAGKSTTAKEAIDEGGEECTASASSGSEENAGTTVTAEVGDVSEEAASNAEKEEERAEINKAVNEDVQESEDKAAGEQVEEDLNDGDVDKGQS